MDQERTVHGTRQTYRIESVLGRGAMGVVYRGTSEKTREPVAVKTLRPDLLQGSERGSVLERFIREAVVSMEMNHPNIVRVLDSGTEEDDSFLVMELIRGKELKGLLERSEAIPLETVMRIMDQLLAALDHAHRHGVVHRDIKPANIMVDKDFSLKITDFGIASVESSEMTQAGALLGTPAFMSPEQIMGEPVDGRADLFSAGVLLYQLLTGVKPFEGQLATIIYQILHETPPLPSSLTDRVPPALDGIVMKALAKDREDRFTDAASFAGALREAWIGTRSAGLPPRVDGVAEAPSRAAVEAPGSPSEERPKGVQDWKAHRRRVQEMLRRCLDHAVTPRLLAELKEGFRAYRDLLEGPPGKDPRLAQAVAADRDLFERTALERLKDLIIHEAPTPGKAVEAGARNDWMLCIDLFRLLGEFIVQTGGTDRAALSAAEAREELMNAAMAYAGLIQQQLSGPDHIELYRISADFMRLDILQWGLEELGGDQDVREMHRSIRRSAGQVLERVNASIRDFLQTREVLARQDVAGLLADIDELIVIATRVIEPSPQAGDSRAVFAPHETDSSIIRTFIENAKELAGLFMEELGEDGTLRKADVTDFQNKLRQLGRLYRFSVLFDDKAFRGALHQLTQGVHDAVEALSGTLQRRLREAEDEATRELLQRQLTVIYELAEELGWVGFCERLMTDLRDGFLVGTGPGTAPPSDRALPDLTLTAGEGDGFVEEGTLMYTDVRSSRAMMEAMEREARQRAEATGEDEGLPPAPRVAEKPRRARAVSWGRTLRLLLVLVVLLGLGLGGHTYYQDVYRPEKTRQGIVEKHRERLLTFVYDDEVYDTFDERTCARQVETLRAMMQQMHRDEQRVGVIPELERLRATVGFMILEREVRSLLEEGNPQEAMQRIRQAKAEVSPVSSTDSPAFRQPYTSLSQIPQLMDLLTMVCRYRQFQLAYPDPYLAESAALDDKALDDILWAKRLKDDFVLLKKRNSMSLSATFRYLEGMVNEVDEYGITLVNRWYHHVFSNDIT